MTSLIITVTAILIVGALYLYFYKKKAQQQAEGFTIWLVFSVILALTPILFNAALTFVAGQTLTFTQLLRNGELLLIAVAVGADSLGKLMASNNTLKLPKIIAGGGSILLVILCSLLFAVVSTRMSGTSIDMERVAMLSSIMFGLTLVAGGSCTLLAEVP